MHRASTSLGRTSLPGFPGPLAPWPTEVTNPVPPSLCSFPPSTKTSPDSARTSARFTTGQSPVLPVNCAVSFQAFTYVPATLKIQLPVPLGLQCSCVHKGPFPSFKVSPFFQSSKQTLASLTSWGCSSQRSPGSGSALQMSLGSLVHCGLPGTEILSAFLRSSLLLFSKDQGPQECYLAIGVLGL